MKLPLSDRLLACCQFVHPGDRVADIGCDHGYLGIHLLQTGIAKSVIESDVNEGPLQSAMRNAVKYGTKHKMTFCLSDGAQNIPRDFDVMVCAGMGADTIISILTAAPWLKEGNYRLILQCQSKRPELRQWLSRQGYRISRETLAKDGRFVYSIMEVTCDPSQPLTPTQCYLSPQLLGSKHPLLPEYYQRVKSGVEMTIFGLKRANDPKLPEFEAILADLTAMEETIYDHRT